MRPTKAEPSSTRTPVGLGFRAVKGGSAVVGVAVEGREPRVVLSTFLATAGSSDRLSLKPYHVAAEIVRCGNTTAQAAAAVAQGRRRQEVLAEQGLDDLVSQLEAASCKPAVAALLINRAGWVSDLLQFSLAFPDHPPVAEGLAVREALRLALRPRELKLLELDEKSLLEHGSDSLARAPADINARVQALGAGRPWKPWRKEQKQACLAAWVAMAAHEPGQEKRGVTPAFLSKINE